MWTLFSPGTPSDQKVNVTNHKSNSSKGEISHYTHLKRGLTLGLSEDDFCSVNTPSTGDELKHFFNYFSATKT